jgi:hypothetical protein
MNNSDVLNFMLSNTCPTNIGKDGVRTFHFDLCCRTIIIDAKLLNNNFNECGDYINTSYEVLSYDIQPEKEVLS